MVSHIAAAQDNAPHAVLGELFDNDADEGAVSDHRHGFRTIADGRSQSGAQPAAENEQIAGCGAKRVHATFSIGIDACRITGCFSSVHDTSVKIGDSC